MTRQCLRGRGNVSTTAARTPRPIIRRLLPMAAAALLTFGGLLAASPAQASVVGTLPGSFGVTPTGAATYSIPIALPRGAGGLTPSLALVYNSQSGSGAAGWGWNLAGLSAITRCSQTIDDDGATQGVQLKSTDDYCLDGQRLRVTSGTSGGDATYDTELRGYSQITSFTGSPTGGPSYWTVETKNGTTYEYGNTADSRIFATDPGVGATTVVRVWALDKVTDANGNFYKITYQNNDGTTGDYWPLTIQYSGNTAASTSPLHELTFGWTPRSDTTVQTSFVDGTLVSQTQLLSTLTVSYNGTTAFTYYLSYQTDANSGRNQLTQVQECAPDNGGSCFNPTTIGWQPAGPPGWQSASPVSGLSGLTQDEALSTHLVDVNGDGIADLLYPGPSDWMVMFGLPNGGFGSAVDTGVPIGNNSLWALTTDANGDGRTDLMVPGTSTWTIYEATGNTTGTIFNPVATGLSDTGTNSVTNLPIYEGNAALADYSGRGLGDFLYSDGTNLYLVPNNGPTSNPQFGSPQNMGALGNLSNGVTTHQTLFSGTPLDFDGSGRGGRLSLTITTYSTQCNPQDQPGCVSNSTTKYTWWPLLSTTSGYVGMTSLVCWASTTPLPLDATGGGLTDLLYSCPATNGNDYDMELSTGTGLITVPTTIPYAGTDPVLADYYGDGREEALVQDSAYSSGWAMIRVNYDPSSASFVPVVGEVPAPLPSSYAQGSLQVGSIEADGLDDLVFAEYNGSTYSLDYELRNPPTPASGVPDTVTSIEDGLGNRWSPTYAMLTNTASYAEGSGAIYPDQDVKAPIAVVTSTSANDGIGGSYTETYSYSSAEMEVTGRGFLGFAGRTATDSRNGVTVSDSYDQSYPFIGGLLNESLTQSNGKALGATVNTYASSPTSCSGGVLCFPYLSTSTVTVDDPGTGNAIKTVTTQNTFGDGYGDLTNQTVTTTDNTTGAQFSTTTVIGYTPDTTNYCIDLPTSVTVTKTNALGTLTRTTSAPQDPSACRPASVTLNPGASPTLTTSFGYDDFGNPQTVTVSGTNLQSDHLTITDYSAYQGEYPDSITRCVVLATSTTCSSGLTTTEFWNPALGVETSMTDPNGHVTSFGYDGFGRRTSETNGEGVVTTWSGPTGYSGAGCPSGVSCYEISASVTSGCWFTVYPCKQTVPLGFTAYDSLGRVVESGKTLLGGATTYVETQYDALGRVVAVSTPSLSTTPSYWTNTTYDVLNRPLTVTAPSSASDPAGRVTNFIYSGFTTNVTETAPSGTITNETAVTTTDALGELTGKTDGSSVCASTNASIAYTYNPFGDLVSTEDADCNITTMQYDALGHKIKMIDPDMGTWTYTPDALGEVVSQTDAKLQTIAQTFDALGRRTSRTEYDASGSVTASDSWSYDTAANGLGLLASESGSDGFLRSYSYNGLSLLEEVDTTVPGTSTPYAVDTGYDNFGRVANVTYPASVAPGAPVASAVANPTGTVVGNNITLDGSGSTDPNGLTLSYQWSETAGPSTATIGSPTGETTTVSADTPGAYGFQLVVSDQNASSTPATVNVTFSPPAPGAPGTSPNPSTTGNYTVSWSSVSGASSYELYESTDGTSYNDLGSVNSTSDALTGRANGSYYYEVSACENSVCGPLSAASAQESVELPPPAPTGLAVSPNPSTTGSFTLTWNSAATASSYDVYSASAGKLGNTTSTSYTATAVDGTVNYYVTACNSSGCGADSASVSETVTLPPGTPGTPSAAPNPSTTGDFTVTWSAPSSTWTSMQFEESPDQSSWTVEASSGTSWPGSGFANGTYYFRTIYCDGSACSTSGTGSVLVTLPPGAPTGLTGSPNPSSSGSYTLSWSPPASGTVTGYDLYSGGGTFLTSTTGTSTSFSGEADGSYSYYVKACNQTACGGASNTVTETVLHVPGVPPSVSLSPSTTYVLDSYTLSWGTASGTVSYYMINGSTSLETSSLSFTFKGKLQAGSYTYYVQACNSSGCGGDSATVTETVQSGGGCKTCSPQVVSPAASAPTPTPAPSASSGGGLASALRNSLHPAAGSPSPIPAAAPIGSEDSGNPVLWALAKERTALGDLPRQPDETLFQAQAAQDAEAALPSLLPQAPAEDVANWNRWRAAYRQAHPTGPDFAPPEYIAWGDAKVEPASGSTYRFEVQYNYDPASGALVSVSNAQTSFVYWQADTGQAAPVDAFGHLLAWTDGNNVSTVMAYDQATGAPVGISSGIGQSTAIQSLTYTWDGYGNLIERQDANQSNLYEKLTYDDLNRLTGSSVTNSAGNGPANDYHYDAMGNITTPTIAGTNETYHYDPNHPYAVDTVTSGGSTIYSASYDADGDMTIRNGYPITWTVDNLPESIASASGSSTFNYDPDGNRYSQAATFNGVTTDTTYIGGLFEVVFTSPGTTEYRHNIIADGEIVAVHTIDQSGNAYTDYLHSDQLGSVDTITDDQGNVIQSMSFDAFGQRRDPNNWDYDLSQNTISTLKNYTDRGYTDQEQLDNLSLVDMNGRVYDPTVGRFISADPTVPDPFYSQAFNRYAYVYNNPLTNFDPSGLGPAAIVPPQDRDPVIAVGGGVLIVLTGIALLPEDLTALSLAEMVQQVSASTILSMQGGLTIGAGLTGQSPINVDFTNYFLTSLGVSPNSALGAEIALDLNELSNEMNNGEELQALNTARELLNLIKDRNKQQSPKTPSQTQTTQSANGNPGVPGNGSPGNNNGNGNYPDICSQVDCENQGNQIPTVTIGPVTLPTVTIGPVKCMKATKNGKPSTCPT